MEPEFTKKKKTLFLDFGHKLNISYLKAKNKTTNIK